ncbi:MAG: endonuclease/exonuclease/phosphatase family protein [Bacteroidaceae bacterium]|nr:endonuclease/exonuclease/phosphatase family protein [Bacteroidaceae bacterium]
MKKFFVSLLLFITFIAADAQPLLVGSYNVRYRNNGDVTRGNGWERRCPVICAQIGFVSPDIFGTQETLASQVRDMQGTLAGYAHIGVGRDDGNEEGEYTAIWYKTERLRLTDSGTFWLSETPDQPSKGWDAALPRICTWGCFKDKQTGKRFYFFNLHLDHIGTVARAESARLVARRISEITKGRPAILTGDFNVDQHDAIYRYLTDSAALRDCFTCAPLRFAETGTFNSFKPDRHTDSRIDHIFVTPGVTIQAYGLHTDSYWSQESAPEGPSQPAAPVRRTPSDHYPIFARLRL